MCICWSIVTECDWFFLILHFKKTIFVVFAFATFLKCLSLAYSWFTSVGSFSFPFPSNTCYYKYYSHYHLSNQAFWFLCFYMFSCNIINIVGLYRTLKRFFVFFSSRSRFCPIKEKGSERKWKRNGKMLVDTWHINPNSSRKWIVATSEMRPQLLNHRKCTGRLRQLHLQHTTPDWHRYTEIEFLFRLLVAHEINRNA